MRTYLAILLAAGVGGAAATQWLFYRFLPLSEVFRWSDLDLLWLLPGAIAGALSAHFVAVIAQPRRRGSRGAVVCAAANTAVWLAFLSTATLSQSEFQQIAARRVEIDSARGGMNFITDQPIVVAARWSGTFGAVNVPDRLLNLSAGPAIGFANMVIVPARYADSATRGESYAVAGLAFFLSTAFWIAAGGLAPRLIRRLRRKGTQPKESLGAAAPPFSGQ